MTKYNTPGRDGKGKLPQVAELRWCEFIAENNLPFNLSDTAPKLFAAMFPDSNIAAAFACGRGKGTYTVNHTFRLVLHNKLVEKLKTAPFSILIDDYK